MRKSLVTIIFAMLVALACPINALAAPDQYCGDAAIYGAAPVVLQPNVLIILDNSGSMDDTVPGGAYDAGTPYPVTNHCQVGALTNQPCVSDLVYTTAAAHPRFLNAGLTVLNVTTACPTAATDPRNLLQTTGQYSGRRLNTNGTCRTSGTGAYQLGNYINWLFGPGLPRPKIDIAQDVLMSLINSTSNVKFGLMQYRSDNQGSRFISRSVGGSNYITTIKDMDAIHTGVTTNRQALVDVVDNVATGPWTPMAESLFEAMRYFQGGNSAFGNTIGITSSHYTSPILFGCEKNYVIFISDGMATADGSAVLNLPLTTYGRYDGGFCVGYGTPAYTTCNDACDAGDGSNTRCHALPGVAKYMYEHNLITGATITSAATRQNNVTTYTIGFGFGGGDTQAIDLLTLTSDDNHGHGKYFDAGSEAALSASLTEIITSILEENSSFVAPVVPVSPENRTYTGSRIYMGFFKPDNTKMWSGNLKKFGLDCAISDPTCAYGKSNVLDATGNYATYLISTITATTPTPYHDSRDNAVFVSGAVNGSFRPGSLSYWSTTPDGGEVESGGAGEVLLNRTFSITSATSNISGDKRKIYTYMGTNLDLTHSSNDFSTTNALITAATLSLPGPVITSGTVADAQKLLNFVHGFNTYGTVPTDKREWILGDILHAKPLAISYNTYTFNAVNEANCAMNKTMIYVSSNDGMLHAFRDCDGSEAWAVIPRELLPDLQYLTGAVHTYFVDSTIQSYVYDHNKNGDIGDEIQDKAVLVIGLRRGTGLTAAPTRGFYYAIDVTDPATPKYMWKISNALPAFSDLGETWSEPRIGKIKINAQEKLVLFLGGGYDNCNEDGRYGATQTFSGFCVNAVATADSGLDGGSLPITSTGATAVSTFPSTGVTAYKGRAVYIVELATLNSNIPDFTLSGTNVIWSWKKSNAANIPAFEFSLLSEMSILDTNDDGYVDRLYIGDVGGNMWRINILDKTNTDNWTVTKIFSSNPGADGSTGRKIFYNPSAFVDLSGNVRLYFGTGDREHPLNRAVTDRMYGLIDKNLPLAAPVTEAKMLDFTVDLIQAGTGAQVMATEVDLNTADDPLDTTLYGWYIRLDAGDRTPAEVYPGEKVLASATVANGVAYFTTYQPIISVSLDPCNPGNLGTARLYAVDYRTAEAVYNWDVSNDSQWGTYNTNTHAIRGSSDTVYLRTDRTLQIGAGIPSGIVYTPPALLIGSGGGISSVGVIPGGTVQPLFWKQRY